MLAPHRGAHASLSEPAFWSDGEGKEDTPKVPGAPERVGGARPRWTRTQRRRGGRRIRPPQMMTTTKHFPVCALDQDQLLVNERQQWEAEGEKAGTRRVPSLNPCSPALVSARRCTPHYPLGESGNEWGEEVGCVEREELVLDGGWGVCTRQMQGERTSEARARSIRFRERHCLL